MNIGEANAANTLMRAALGQEIDRDRIRDAGELLARNAHKALMAGFTPDSWTAAWDVIRPEPSDPPPDPWAVEHNPRCNRLCGGGDHHLEDGDSMDPVR